ncbi:MAG: hypothetical protein JWN98_1636 [Abditibacteriota bacterium]|nr:hypothetical protein [Abditibacteriota bacterium]
MNGRLAGKVAVITGSTSGIGRACAHLFAEHGACIVVNGFPPEAGEPVVEAIRSAGGSAAYCHADVRRSDDLKQLMQFAVDTFGRLDIVMNNAFCGHSTNAIEQTEEDWDDVFASSVKATYLGCKYAIPLMTKAEAEHEESAGPVSLRGSIINTASVHGLLGSTNNAAYDAAKAAMINLTRQMAVDYGPQGIRVNALCPGWIATDEHMEWVQSRPDQARRQQMIYPLGRPGTMREAAYAALFLASDESSFVTGHALVVDGGLTIQLQDSLANKIERSIREERQAEFK